MYNLTIMLFYFDVSCTLQHCVCVCTQIEGTFTTVKVSGVHPEPSPEASLMKHFSAFGTVVAIKVLPPQGIKKYILLINACGMYSC
jgi:hypothetical protein